MLKDHYLPKFWPSARVKQVISNGCQKADLNPFRVHVNPIEKIMPEVLFYESGYHYREVINRCCT